jgi:hypothetical protein
MVAYFTERKPGVAETSPTKAARKIESKIVPKRAAKTTRNAERAARAKSKFGRAGYVPASPERGPLYRNSVLS